MNMMIDAQSPVSGNTETTTTTYRPATRSQGSGSIYTRNSAMGRVSGSGCRLDIADKVMDNEAYGGHGMTTEDIMQQAANSNAQSKKDFMIVMSSCVSGEDLQKMQEEGFEPGSTDVETYVTIVDKIKVTLAQAGVEVAGYTDNIDKDTIEQITGSRVDANSLVKQLSDALQKSDIPVTNDNIDELVNAVMEALGISELSDDAVKYLVVNGKAPTIENIYKAQYSSAQNIMQSQGYYSDGAGNYGKYYAKKADDINWNNLEGQIESVVKQAGLDTDAATNAQAVENAKWLVASGIELNAENLTKVTKLKNLSLPMEQSDIADMCVTAMENGKAPIKADMTGEVSIAEQAHDIKVQVDNISDEAVHAVVENGEDINIKNLSNAQRQIDARNIANDKSAETFNDKTISNEVGETAIDETLLDETAIDENVLDKTSLKEIQARRQLEEIRLMMTEEANRHLMRAGISIDTTELSKLVEALKAAEDNIRSVLFQGENAAENEQRALLYEETLTKTKELAEMPAAVLGKILSKIQQSTILNIHEAGSELKNQLSQDNASQQHNQQGKSAVSAYETLMTEPRKDLGDKISKAFRNIDDILTDLGLETSETNRRAVRILGYNSMEITEENIDAVKAADSQVTGVINRMTPATTLQMIREQKNPLEMTMNELDEYLNSKGLDPSVDAEKYSKFLQRLDRSNGISEDEREAYIGIYRMFRQIEKSDGAVIGSLVASGAQVNFKNMLSAVRSSSSKNMDVRVDDGFGGLENLITKGKAIDTQINAGYHNQAGSENHGQGAEDTTAQEKYYARLSGEINTGLAQNTDFDKLDTKSISGETTIEQFAETIKTTQVPENSEMRVKEKAEDLKNFQNNMHEVEQIDEQVIDTLFDYNQSINVDNIQAAAMLIFDRGSLFAKVIRQQTDDSDSETENVTENDVSESDVLKQANDFIEQLTDAKQANAFYKEIITEANKAVEKMIYENGSSHIDVKAAKSLYKGLALAGRLANEENYEVPMDIKGEITSVNLKIYHNASQTGKVAVTFDTEKLGKVAAEFDVTDKRISGMVAYENNSGKTDLEQLEAAVKQELGSTGKKQVSVSLVQTKSVNLNNFGQDRKAAKDSKVSTGELYRTAKAFLTALKDL